MSARIRAALGRILSAGQIRTRDLGGCRVAHDRFATRPERFLRLWQSSEPLSDQREPVQVRAILMLV